MHPLGQSDEADHELTLCADDARTNGWRLLEAAALQQRGRIRFDRADYPAALADFERALRLRSDAGAGADQLEPSKIAIAVTEKRLGTGGRASEPEQDSELSEAPDPLSAAEHAASWRSAPGPLVPSDEPFRPRRSFSPGPGQPRPETPEAPASAEQAASTPSGEPAEPVQPAAEQRRMAPVADLFSRIANAAQPAAEPAPPRADPSDILFGGPSEDDGAEERPRATERSSRDVLWGRFRPAEPSPDQGPSTTLE